MSKHKPEQYEHIRTWGIFMGSYAYYIRNEQEKASNDNAPIDAVYFKQGQHGMDDAGEWVCASDLAADHRHHEQHKDRMVNPNAYHTAG